MVGEIELLGHGVSFQLLYNQFPQTQQLETACVYYLTVSVGQTSGQCLSKAEIKVLDQVYSLLGLRGHFQAHMVGGQIQFLTTVGLWSQLSCQLKVVGHRLLSVPRGLTNLPT